MDNDIEIDIGEAMTPDEKMIAAVAGGADTESIQRGAMVRKMLRGSPCPALIN